jgi:7,8-dihydropterin-6-yl-methyl-4-(beta-D-ribofuranosyl)aminobenzene 5'-phosphate synthase
MHEKALLPKYVLRKGKMQFIGTKGEYITKNSSKHVNNDQKTNDSTKVEFISKTIEIAPNIYIFPEISLKYDFEGIDPSFLICDNGNFLSDNFEDELVLVIRTDKGLVVLSGCAHRGIVNTVSSVVEYFNDDIYAVIGGTHLVSSNEDRLNKTSKELKKFDPDQLIFGHCNGFDAQCRFKKEFKNKFQILESGKEINII